MTKRIILGTSLGQFVLTKATTLAKLKEAVGELTIETVTDGGDKSKTTFNLDEVKLLWLYVINKAGEVTAEDFVEMDTESKA